MTRVKIVERYFSTTGSTKYSLRVLRNGEEPAGWLNAAKERVSDRSKARVFDTVEEAAGAAAEIGYEVVD